MEFLTALNFWIETHQALLVSIGVPLLTLAVTVITSRASERRAERSRIADRALQTELKLVEFRQKWISELRDDFAQFHSLTGKRNGVGPADMVGCYTIQCRVVMRMNLEDPNLRQLVDIMARCTDELTSAELGHAHAEFTLCAQRILKTEWDRLKSDLRSVQGGMLTP